MLTILGVLYAALSAVISVLYVANIGGVGLWQRLQIVLYSAGMFTLGLVIRNLRESPRGGPR